jgi:hypothetical protein
VRRSERLNRPLRATTTQLYAFYGSFLSVSTFDDHLVKSLDAPKGLSDSKINNAEKQTTKKAMDSASQAQAQNSSPKDRTLSPLLGGRIRRKGDNRKRAILTLSEEEELMQEISRATALVFLVQVIDLPSLAYKIMRRQRSATTEIIKPPYRKG